MEFLGAFAVIFLLIFAAAMLAYLLWNMLRSGYAGTFDIYIKPDDNLEQFIIHARRDAYIGDIYIISDGSISDTEELAELKELTEKYENVVVIDKTDW